MNRKGIVAVAIMVMLVVALMISGCSPKSGSGSSGSGLSGSGAESESAEKIGIKHAEINVKDYGKIVLELDGDVAPITVANFVALAESGFYDGLTFHRIMDGFMIQGGDPSHDGTGGSEETIIGEFKANGYKNSISHVKGTVSMARRSNDNNSASSQFFIMVDDATYLDGSYAAFGHVTEGQDIVDKIASDAEPVDNNGTIPFENQPVIESIVILD